MRLWLKLDSGYYLDPKLRKAGADARLIAQASAAGVSPMRMAAGVGDEPLSPAEVIEAGRAAAAPFARLLDCALGRMHASLERAANELRRSRS